MTDTVKKSGSSLMIRLLKKDFTMSDIEHMYKAGTKIRAVIEIMDDDCVEDIAAIETVTKDFESEFVNNEEKKVVKNDNPFSTSVDLLDHEIPDEPKPDTIDAKTSEGK